MHHHLGGEAADTISHLQSSRNLYSSSITAVAAQATSSTDTEKTESVHNLRDLQSTLSHPLPLALNVGHPQESTANTTPSELANAEDMKFRADTQRKEKNLRRAAHARFLRAKKRNFEPAVHGRPRHILDPKSPLFRELRARQISSRKAYLRMKRKSEEEILEDLISSGLVHQVTKPITQRDELRPEGGGVVDEVLQNNHPKQILESLGVDLSDEDLKDIDWQKLSSPVTTPREQKLKLHTQAKEHYLRSSSLVYGTPASSSASATHRPSLLLPGKREDYKEKMASMTEEERKAHREVLNMKQRRSREIKKAARFEVCQSNSEN